MNFQIGCSPQKKWTDCLSEQEREDLEIFFNVLLFEDYGAYVLFGSKPMSSSLLLPDISPEEVARRNLEIDESILKVGYFCECYFIDQWKTWLSVQDRFPMQKYKIAFRSLEFNKLSRAVFLIDVHKFTKILEENRSYFCTLFKGEFDPDSVINECSKEDSGFWKKILKDHFAMGVLFGYGKENAALFGREDALVSTEENYQFKQGNAKKFGIPIFRNSTNDPLVKKYQQEREKIQKVYQGRDVLEVTLRELTSVK